MLKKGDLILFQGDSITDCSRNKEQSEDLGLGYPRLVTGALAALRPSLCLRTLNRGISGNRSLDLLNRWEEECVALQPAMLSILVGINDVWHRQKGSGCTNEELEANYRAILTRTRQALGDIPILMMEPYLMPETTSGICREDVDSILTIVRRLSREFGARLIPLDGILNAYCNEMPSTMISADGVHPTPQGHGMIAKHWLDAALPLI